MIEALGDLRAKEVVIFGVDPEHGDAGFFSEIVEGGDDIVGMTDGIGSSRTAAASEADGGEETGRRIGGERNVGETSSGNADADDAGGIDFGESGEVSDGFAQVFGGLVASVEVLGVIGAGASVFVIASAGIAVAATENDDGGPAAASKFASLRNESPGSHGGTLIFEARSAVSEKRERMWAGFVGADHDGFETFFAGRVRGDAQIGFD
jgi:hypothetical protein